jgi:hypothetical protein
MEVLNTYIHIHMVDDCHLSMGCSAVNGPVDIFLHEPARVTIGDGCLFGPCEIFASDMHSIIDMSSGKRINLPRI